MADTVTTYYQSPVGLLKISGTDEYISEITFQNEMPESIVENVIISPLLIECTEQLIQYFNGERRVFDFPMNQTGTDFQQKTWSLLLNIPFAKTISYMQLAIQTGDPKATRAVANANGRNNIAIVVPCHRVIGSDNTLTGYAGGLWRKKWLLDHEKKVAYGVQTLF